MIWGFGLRQIVETTIIPIALYGASTWYIPEGGLGFAMQEKYVLRKMGAIQRRGAQIASGNFKTVAGAVVNCKIAMMPPE